MMRRWQHSSGRRVRRGFLAGLLAAVLLIQSLPLAAFADEAQESAMTWKAMGSPTADTGTAAKNTYVFEVSSGTRQGGGVADNILYFLIQYTTSGAYGTVKRTQVVMPGENDLASGYALADGTLNYQSARRKLVQDTFGVAAPAPTEKKALGSVQTDQFCFTTPDPVVSIDKVQIFGRKNAGASDWACQAMRFYRVDTLYGVKMVGWFSGETYIDFDGPMIAEVDIQGEMGNFRWDNSGGTFNIVPAGQSGGTPGVTLVTQAGEGSHVGDRHESLKAPNVYFRMDLADQEGAGFDCLANFYELGSKPSMAQQQFCEAAALTVMYRTVYGETRQVSLPVVVNALGQTMETLGNVAVAGFGQQGDTLVIPAVLPELDKVLSTRVTMGENEALAAAGLLQTASGDYRQRRHDASETETIRYLNFAVYQNSKVSAALDGAVLRYRFEGGAGQPNLYAASTSVGGVTLGTQSDTYIYLQDYSPDMTLLPVDNTEKYLVTMQTDTVANAGTKGDITLQFRYLSMKDAELVSEEYDLRQYARRFYGEWPGSVDDFAYQLGVSQGGLLRVIVPLQGVKQFLGVSAKLRNGDEWQVRGITVAMVKTAESRQITWEEVASSELDSSGSPALRSHLRVDRRVSTKDISFRAGKTDGMPDANGETGGVDGVPQPGDDSWTPGTLVIDDGTVTDLGGDGENVSTRDDVDWENLRHYMTFADTQRDLGFTRERCRYTVTVKVAGDQVSTATEENPGTREYDPANDDAGSKNLFFFQLIFKNGQKSGCVLANQQIVGDAFRTGAQPSFTIVTSQDYGDLAEILVIPDDQDGNGDIYDKLKIEYIEVTKNTNDAISPTWAARTDSPDGLGWVGIDYRDPGEISSNQGAKGRTVSQLATSYQVTESSYSAKLLVSIKTGAYGKRPRVDENGNLVHDVQIFSGGLSLSYSYLDTAGRFISGRDSVDVIEAMDSYAGRKSTRVRNVSIDGESKTENVSYCVSDPEYQFRPGGVDSFFLDVKDISQLTDLKFQIRSNVVTEWNIQEVNVYLINGTGTRYLSADGYAYRYPDGMGPSLLTKWNRRDGIVTPLQMYRTETKTPIAVVDVALEGNKVELSKDAAKWSSVIPRAPISSNDTLNLFFYPATGTGSTSPSEYDLGAAVRYTSALNKHAHQISAGTLSYTTDAAGRPVFYALGLNAANLEGIVGVDVLAEAQRSVQAPISYGVVQQVRGGVLVESYRLDGVPNAGNGDTMALSTSPVSSTTQRLLIQVAPTAKAQTLEAETKDLALALYFRSNVPGTQELRSKYVYLTDLGVTSIRPGQLLDIPFSLGGVSEVTGVNMVTLGNVEIPLENGLVVDQDENGTVLNKWMLNGGMTPSVRPVRYGFNFPVELVTLDLGTALDEASLPSGTKGPVKLTVGYYDRFGEAKTRVYNDIRPYIQSGQGFVAGQSDRVQILVPTMVQARWIELEPTQDAATNAAGNTQTQTQTQNQTQTDAGTTSQTPAQDGTASGTDAQTTPGTTAATTPGATAQFLASWKVSQVTVTVGVGGQPLTRTLNQRVVERSPLHIGLADIQMAGMINTVTPAVNGQQPVISSTEQVAVGETKAMAMDSGNTLRVNVVISGSTEGFTAELKQIDPDTGAESPAKLDATHGYQAAELTRQYEAALEAVQSAASSEAERTAAQRVVTLLTAMRAGAGSFPAPTDSWVNFTPPRNYTAGRMVYRLKVASKENPDTGFTVDITVRNETDQLPEALKAWEAVRATGEIKVTDANGNVVENVSATSEAPVSKLVQSGGGMVITPRAGSQNVEASILSLDPVTGATGAAQLTGRHSYTDASLSQMEAAANDSLRKTQEGTEEASAALAVLSAIAQVRNSSGDFTSNAAEIRFTAPRNYSGSNLYYRITLYSRTTGGRLITVDVSVSPEEDRLGVAYTRLQTARTAANRGAPDPVGETQWEDEWSGED